MKRLEIATQGFLILLLSLGVYGLAEVVQISTSPITQQVGEFGY